jgi:type I restriction-modification system DNA methylase subunit
MSKTFDQGREEIAKLCKYFANNRHDFFAPGVKEAHVRQSLIDPFFEALGWDMRNAAMTALQYREVIPEDSLEIEGQQKAPDYTFRIGTLAKFYTEAKKCGVNINADPGPAYQLRRYGWSAKMPLSILTDFDELGVYDCSLRPRPSDKASFGRIQYFRDEEYPDRWRELWDIFSREAVWAGAYDRYAASKRKRGTSEVDSEFLKEIEGWRDSLARNIALRNLYLGYDDLNTVVQRTIDRLIFLRMAEDRGSEPYGQLLKLCEQPDIYTRFVGDLCRKADEKYNSGLFHFKKEEGIEESPDLLTPRLEIDDKVIKPILQNLYFEHGSPYHFGVLPVEILGTVYERFLGKVIRLTADHRAKVEEKPEVRKAGGVYYTPAYIVNYIVTNTVGKMIEGKSPAQLAGGKSGQPLRVLDMACGSGSFLLGAFQCLLDHCLKWYLKNRPEKHKEAVYLDRRGKYWRLTIAEKKRILITHIFGVDIDPQAVEVSKLSLLLKVLEGETDETVGQSRQLFHERALPNLSKNIKCGNSLIGPDYFSGRLIPDPDEIKRVNTFDWQREFPEAIKSGGFDCVIGNPPWGASIENAHRAYLSARFPDVADFESSQYFLICSLSLVNDSGVLGMIIPNTFVLNIYAKRARQKITEMSSVTAITDLSSEKVFKGPSVRSIVIFLSHKKQDICYINEFRNDILVPLLLQKVSTKQLVEAETWKAFLTKETPLSKFLSVLIEKNPSLAEYCDVKQGYIPYRTTTLTRRFGKVKATEIVKGRLWHSNKRESRDYQKELQGSDVGRYALNWSGVWVKYGEWVSTYLPMTVFSGPRILIREITGRPPNVLLASYTEDMFVHNPSVLTVLPRGSVSPKFLLGVINSRLMSSIFRFVAPKSKKGLFPKIIITDARRLPMPKLNLLHDKAQNGKLVDLVDKMLALKLHEATSESEKAALQNAVTTTDAEIDRLVYELYGLTAEEIKIVEEIN